MPLQIDHSQEVRYNPPFSKPFGSVYRPWFFVFGFMLVLLGVVSIGVSIATNEVHGDVDNDLFQLWVGVPVAVVGLISIAVCLSRSKKMATFLLIISLIVMVICATGALLGGLVFWRDRWSQARYRLIRDGDCSVVSGICVCTGIVLPARMSKCDDLKEVANLMITQIAMAAGAFLFCVLTVYLSMMAICCGHWQYMDEKMYDKRFDPDFTDQDAVKIRSIHTRSSSFPQGTDNPSFGR